MLITAFFTLLFALFLADRYRRGVIAARWRTAPPQPAPAAPSTIPGSLCRSEEGRALLLECFDLGYHVAQNDLAGRAGFGRLTDESAIVVSARQAVAHNWPLLEARSLAALELAHNFVDGYRAATNPDAAGVSWDRFYADIDPAQAAAAPPLNLSALGLGGTVADPAPTAQREHCYA